MGVTRRLSRYMPSRPFLKRLSLIFGLLGGGIRHDVILDLQIDEPLDRRTGFGRIDEQA